MPIEIFSFPLLWFLLILFLLAAIVFVVRLILKEDADSTVSYLVVGITILIFELLTRRFRSLFEIPAFLLATYLIGTITWGLVALLRRLYRLVFQFRSWPKWNPQAWLRRNR